MVTSTVYAVIRCIATLQQHIEWITKRVPVLYSCSYRQLFGAFKGFRFLFILEHTIKLNNSKQKNFVYELCDKFVCKHSVSLAFVTPNTMRIFDPVTRRETISSLYNKCLTSFTSRDPVTNPR